MREKGIDALLKDLNLFMLLSLITGSVIILILFRDLKIFLAFVIGALLAYLNFYTLKKEGRELLFKVYHNVMACMERPYQRERTLFLIKVYLRLLALGIIFYVLMAKLGLHPVFLILGFSLVYFQIFLAVFRFWLQRRESL